MSKLLEVKNIVTTFKGDGKTFPAVNGVSLEIQRGEIVGLVGESGSGKSVTSMSILQLIQSPGKVAGGEVYLEGAEGSLLDYGATSPQIRAVRGGRIGMIFQEPMTSLNPVLTIGFQIQEAIMLHLGLDEKAAKERAIEMMRKVGISDPERRFDQYPQHFSGGMRQRIMIAMVLAAEPDILIADEATTALDVTTQAQILELLKDLVDSTNVAVMIITHNLGIVARYADRIYVMYSGNVVETAGKYEIFGNPTHPYTRGLLNAIPRLDDRKDRKLVPIEGMPPNPANQPSYCRFYDRCPYRCERCLQGLSDLEEISPGHYVRCWLSKDELDAKRREIEEAIGVTPEKHISDEVCMEVKDLKMYFPLYKGMMKTKIGDVKAVEGVSFQVRKGETLGIVGESGCGKSTLARCIMRAYEPTEGEILYHGMDLAKMNERQLRPIRPEIAMIFQDPFSSLDPRQTAASIVAEPLRINKMYRTREEYDQRVDELFRMVGLDPTFKNRMPREFSGGQRQRLGIARALASNPKVIVCDEPVSALDVSIQAQVINLLEDLQAKLGITYLFIAHDLSVVKHISDTILVMYLGLVVEIGDCESLYSAPLHPYTKALLSAVPIADPTADEGRERIKLLGEVPSVMNRPVGCPFSDRCQYATERCRKERPPLREQESNHKVACWLYESR